MLTVQNANQFIEYCDGLVHTLTRQRDESGAGRQLRPQVSQTLVERRFHDGDRTCVGETSSMRRKQAVAEKLKLAPFRRPPGFTAEGPRVRVAFDCAA